jgi:ATP-dependent Clp protease protease subunit
LDKEIKESFLKNRTIFLWKSIDEDTGKDIVSQLLYLDSLNNDDITLYINSPGGVITAGMAILDAMDAVKSDIRTIVMGQAASMASVIQAYGTKGKRYVWPRSRIMIHQPLIRGHVEGVTTDINIQAAEILRMRTTLNQMLSDCTGQPLSKIESDTDRDYFMTAADALAYGMVDFVETVK